MFTKLSLASFITNLFLLVVLTWPLVGLSQPKQEKKTRPKVALVLSGGGAKGFAHIGVLKVLEEEGIPIDLIVGTSMGSLVGGIYSIGYDASELEALVKSLNWETALTDEVPREFLSKNDQLIKQRYILSLPISGQKKLSLPQGLINGQNVLNIFCGLAGNVPYDADFAKLPIAFACVAADLKTGKEVVLKKGFFPTAMFSSMAIPLAFQSFERGDQLLVDGGVVNNFPTDVAKKMGADIIIGVDIRSNIQERTNLGSMSSVLSQLVSFFDHGKDSVNKSLCDLIIRPEVSDYSVSSFNNKAVDTLILRGELAASEMRDQLREIKHKYQLEPREKSRLLVKPDKWHITGVQFSGNYHLDMDFLLNTLSLQIPGDLSADEIKSAIDRLYGMGGFDRIYYNLIDAGNGKIINFNISTKTVFTQNIGFKANTTDAAAILINTTQKNYKNIFGLLSLSAELSVNPGMSLLAESNKTNLPTAGVSINAKFQNYNVFEKGDKISETNVFYSSGSLYAYQAFLKRFNFGLGIQEEYYRGDIFSINSNYPITINKSDIFLTNAYSYLSFDNMDDFYFPSKGTNLYTEFSLLGDFQRANKISPTLLFKMRNVIQLTNKTALLADLYGRAIYDSEFPLFKMTLVGGEPYSQYFNYHLPFVGLASVNTAERFTYIGLLGLRERITGSQYISILFNGMWQDSDINLGDGITATYGGGIRYSIKTVLGPLDMTLGYSNSTEKPTFSANFGYWF